MSLREQWGELDTAVKVIVGLAVGAVALFVLVAVVVVFAAVIGSFVLGVGSTADASTAPQVEFEVEYGTADGSPAATVIHDGGDTLSAADVAIDVDGRTEDWSDDDGDLTAGEEVTVEVSPGATLQVVWFNEEGPQVLYEDETPPEGSY